MRIAHVIHVLMALLLFALPARAQMAPPKDALDGIDAVALLTQGKEITGKPEFKVTRGTFDYLFATAGNKATIVDGKIYIFGSDDCHTKFVAAPAKFLPKPAAAMPTAARDVQAGRALLDKALASLGGAAKVDAVAAYIETASQTQTRPQGQVTLTLKTIRR